MDSCLVEELFISYAGRAYETGGFLPIDALFNVRGEIFRSHNKVVIE